MRPLSEAERERAGACYARALEMARRAEARLRRRGQRGDFAYLVDAATTGLLDAARAWNEATTANFWTYARLRIWYVIRGAVASHVRDRERRPEPIGCDCGGVIDSRDPATVVDSEDYLAWLFEESPADYRAAVRAVFVDGVTRREAGKTAGVGKRWMSVVARRERARLRQLIEERDRCDFSPSGCSIRA